MFNFARQAVMPLLLIVMIGCSESTQAPEGQSAAEQPKVGQTKTPAAIQATTKLPANQGRVLGHISVSGYSYLEVENNGSRFWIAGNPVEVEEGEIVGWNQSAVMTDFYSKSLDRTFEQILFVSDIHFPAKRARAEPDNRGKVLTVQNAANYSYLEIETKSGATFWLAAPEIKVDANDMVSWKDGSIMRDFTSNSLNRTFTEILFVSGVVVEN